LKIFLKGSVMNKSYQLFNFKRYLSNVLFTLMTFILVACSPGSNSPSNTNVSSNNTITASANNTAQNLAVGVAATNFSPLTASGGTTPYSYSHTGTLPTGLSLNPTTGVVSGTPTEAYATASIIFSVKDANNVVASTTSSVSYTVTQHFAYVTNYSTNTISSYSINSTTGALTPVSGSPFAAGTQPMAMAITPNGKFAYASNSGSNNVSAYSINSTTGVLTQISGSPFVAGTSPGEITIAPSGQFLYVANWSSNNISAFSINQTTGALTPLSGSPFASLTYASFITFGPNANFVYVSSTGSVTNNIAVYSFNSATGALTPITGTLSTSTIASGGLNVRSITFDKSGQFAYAANNNDGSIGAFAVNGTTGALTALSGSPYFTGTVIGIYTVLTDPSSGNLYATNINGYISGYTINSTTGALTALAGSPFTVGGWNLGLGFEQSGHFGYFADSNGYIDVFSVNASTGSITANSSTYDGGGPYSVTIF
jgi:6-phosphogluconolactonase (cycloisomerase 2 family)